ncbi:MAG: UDP-N-acetylmuramate--L-alanine ligase [Deltaproteobacteria bacterium]|nr:UDP-N-acetylmuramate--L-alanine ligase [Deltaproteobacteria bacterium]
MFRKRNTHIHFVGIGGIGMSGIAEVLLNLGYKVSGSDQRPNDSTRRLASLGGVIAIGHAAENIGDCDVVVTSSAIRGGNPEVDAAHAHQIPVIPRAEMLAELMRMKYGIAVAGSHGKTTTTSLVATVMDAAGLDPTAVIGGKLPLLGSNARLGGGEYLVAEADESDGSFMKLTPTVAVVTNIDPEHLDHYGDLETLKRTFVDFINKIPFYGLAVLCLDHPEVQAILPRVKKRHVTYGLAAQADYRACDVRAEGLRTHFRALLRGTSVGEVTVAMPGLHNVQNALATLAVADFLEIPFAVYQRALLGFAGVQRRFTIRGEASGVTVVDDYGHHPEEIKATLAAARGAFPGRRVVAVFQPHRYTRAAALCQEFARAFNQADRVVCGDVYAAGEDPITGVSGRTLGDAIRAHGHKHVTYVGAVPALADHLAGAVQPGDVVITLGAGDIWQAGAELLKRLAAEGKA